MYIPRRRDTLIQRLDLVVFVTLQQLNLHFQLQAKQTVMMYCFLFHLPGFLQQLIYRRLLIHIKRKVTPLHLHML